MVDYQYASGSEASSDAIRLDEVWVTLELCAAGLATAEVADRLGVDPDTVRGRVERAKSILGAGSKLEAVIRALRSGLITPPAPHAAIALRPEPLVTARALYNRSPTGSDGVLNGDGGRYVPSRGIP